MGIFYVNRYVYIYLYVCSMYVCIYVSMGVCMYVCMYVCIDVCMYAMYVYPAIERCKTNKNVTAFILKWSIFGLE